MIPGATPSSSDEAPPAANGHIAAMSALAATSTSTWRELVKPAASASSDDLSFLAGVEAHKFNYTSPVAKPVARFCINDSEVCTAGNLTAITAQAKSGKTSYIAALMAAAIVAEYGIEADTLGVTASKPGTLPLIYIDTEQSHFDGDQLIRRVLKRAKLEGPPPAWLWPYRFPGLSAAELWRAIKLIVAKAWAQHGGIFALILDGVADLVLDVNDAAESNALIAWLREISIRCDTPVIGVIHENPGADNGKGRGHLGSQFERKAESNIRLRKKDQVTVVFSEKMRGKPITLKDGPKFAWDDDAGMHVSVTDGGAGIALKDAARVAGIIECFRRDQVDGAVRLETVATRVKVSDKTIRRIFKDAGGTIQHEGEELCIGHGQIKSVFNTGRDL